MSDDLNRLSEDMPYEVYRAHPGLNASLAWDLVTMTPAHAWMRMQQRTDTEAKRLGRAFHCLALEGEAVFESRYWTAEKPTGKGSRTAWKETTAGESRTFLKPEDAATVRAMAAAVRPFLPAGLLPEVSLFWKSGEYKARLDGLTPFPGNTIIELKSADDVSDRAFLNGRWGAFSLGYDFRAYWYKWGLSETTGMAAQVELIVCESHPPFSVRRFSFDELCFQRAHTQRDKALEIYERCQRTGEWPGYGKEVEVIHLPAWLAGELGDE